MVDAASRLGPVQYESPEGGPDIRLRLPSGRWLWLEATFLQDKPRQTTQQGITAALKHHAVYRKVRKKREQHNVLGPRIVCIGGGRSPALSPLVARTTVSATSAAFAALRRTGALSGALIVHMYRQRADAGACINERARVPLTEEEWDHLLRLDFNRWRFFARALEDQERIPESRIKQASGVVSAQLPLREGNMKITIPGPLLLETLIEDKSLAKVYGSRPDDPIPKILAEGWRLVGCRFIEGSIEKGVPSAVEMELAPAHEPVFWPPEQHPVQFRGEGFVATALSGLRRQAPRRLRRWLSRR